LGEDSPGNASARYNIFYDESVMPESQSLLAKGSKRGDYFLTERLNINNVEERKFIRNLFELIRQRSFDFDSIIQQNDLRAIDDEQLLPDMQKLESNRLQAKTPVSSYLWMAFLIVLAVERILSAIRKQ
ncbi:MAG: hypothetical protein R3345_15570, partial [Fulvivirga sp.]|nr:hypothetical protein [Fulvivirga sp.]